MYANWRIRQCCRGEGEGQYHFRDLLRDEVQMRAIFQHFVFNFFRIEQSEFAPRSEGLRRKDMLADGGAGTYLPGMITDVTLESPQRKIIVDTKYYAEAFQEHFGKRSIHSSHLYQIFAYVMNAEKAPTTHNVEGCLLYPAMAGISICIMSCMVIPFGLCLSTSAIHGAALLAG
jgi:5-methylcytosine-specific restriction enzyme subunit McrC